MDRLSALAALVIALAAPGWACAALPLGRVEIGAPAPDFQAAGADGAPHRLSDYAGKVVVLEWTSPVCPYTTLKYRAGAMQAVQKRAARQGVVWITVNTSAPGRPGYLSAAAARTRVAKTGMHVTAFLSDPDGAIGRVYGARTTPSLYVIGQDGRLAYQGAFDNDPARSSPGGQNYVTAALADLAGGRQVGTPETRPYGCAVEY